MWINKYLLRACKQWHGHLIYNLHTDYDTLPFHFILITKILGWKGCPPLVLDFLQQAPLSVAWMREFGASRKTSMLKFPPFPSINISWITGTLGIWPLESSAKKKIHLFPKWQLRPGTLTKPPPLTSVCGRRRAVSGATIWWRDNA